MYAQPDPLDSHPLLSPRPELAADAATAGPVPFLRQNVRDNSIRWRPGERLQDIVLPPEAAGRVAVETEAGPVTFAELDASANRLAHHLIARGTRPGDRIAILLPRSLQTYVATLAVLKTGAAYVPLDPGFPPDRIGFILQDAAVARIITSTGLRSLVHDARVETTVLEETVAEVAAEDATRPELAAVEADPLCYVIYTSGSTGRPKGVPICHSSVCNFVRVAAETYGILPDDRMYQGLTIAFDFSVEEIWVPLALGATIVPGPPEGNLVGHDLGMFLRRRGVTALCCVPTLLATLKDDLPGLRFLLVSGEACPQDLVKRWHRPGRVLLNAYGPTEATVTATLTELHPERPVTIGRPLPTYTALVLDPNREVALPHGEIGELAIAGICLSEGYLNRRDLTDKAFVPDFAGVPDNPSGRIYRTGDLARVTPEGEIEYLGRIDTQVKVRGYRIELTEIESVLMQVPEIAQAVVTTHEPLAGLVELVAYYTLKDGAAPPTSDRLFEELRMHLPSYMVPSYFETLDEIPLLPSQKADRASLPPPAGRRFRTAEPLHYEPPRTSCESAVAMALAEVLQLEQVSVTDHFFDDLGGNSLLMAHVLTRIRERLDSTTVAMKDMYLHPTVRRLAAHIEGARSTPLLRTEPRRAAGRAQYLLCGLAQAGAYFAYLLLVTALFVEALGWTAGGTGPVATYQRAVIAAAGVFLTLCLLPIALKWLLVGCWRAERFPVWSWRYFRFWLVKQLVRTNPLVLFVGSPIYVLYLRALGARIGRDVVILTQRAPVATDLISIGDGAVVRKDAYLSGYTARSGMIETGPVTIGAGAFVGEQAFVDIDTVVGEGGQLAHASCLHRGCDVPPGRAFHGSPATETDTRFSMVTTLRPSRARKLAYSAAQLATALLVTSPLLLFLPVVMWRRLPEESHVLIGESFGGFHVQAFLADQLFWSLGLYFGGLLIGLVAILTLPRLAYLLIEPAKEYPLYGPRYFAFRFISAATNSQLYNTIFGDSSFIVAYLRALGYRIERYVQTGSNFGVRQKHDVPYLCEIGHGTIVSDGLSMVNAAVSSGSFRLATVRIGADSFLGNHIVVPAEAHTGDNCLLGSKVMVPVDGPVRENVGLLGSPPFEIPRSVLRDRQFDHYKVPEVLRARLTSKNWHNLGTIVLYLASRWLLIFLVLTAAAAAYANFAAIGTAGFAAVLLALSLAAPAYMALVERLSLGFGRLEPRYCSIYDGYFWWHERHWKLSDTSLHYPFNGTPFKNVLWRLMGVRWGRMNFDDGCSMSERTLVKVGDHNTFGEQSILQPHSLEDGTFKSDRIRIGSFCTVAAGAYVHYGATLADGSVVEPDTFLMKGEATQPDEVWWGNPARQRRA